VASGITLIPDISQNTGISSGFVGISAGADITGNNPNAPVTGALLTEAGGAILTEAGGTILT
jgi:hypothetical protein